MAAHLHETKLLRHWRETNEALDEMGYGPIRIDDVAPLWSAGFSPNDSAHEIIGRAELAAMFAGGADYAEAFQANRRTCEFCANPADDRADVRRAMGG